MKRSVKKQLKIVLASVSLIIFIAMSIIIFITVKHPEVRTEKIRVVGYNNKSDVQYKVMLKPNPLYDTGVLDEGSLYLASFVDNIKTNFQYEFDIEQPADIKGEYEILAIIEGYINVENKVKRIWSKQFVLSPHENFISTDTKVKINKEMVFPLQQYEDFATQINDAAKLNVSLKATIVMNGHLEAAIGSRIIEKSFSPAIVVPIDDSYFEIIKGGIEDSNEAIEDTKQIPLPVNKKLIAIYGTALGISLLALLYLLIFVKGDAKVDLFIKQLNKIFKTHGSRLVAINNEIGTSFAMYYKVKSIDDLVRMADELGKPIMYKYSTDPKEITKFYIHDDKAMYSFNLKDMLAEKDAELKEKEEKILNNSKDIPME